MVYLEKETCPIFQNFPIFIGMLREKETNPRVRIVTVPAFF